MPARGRPFSGAGRHPPGKVGEGPFSLGTLGSASFPFCRWTPQVWVRSPAPPSGLMQGAEGQYGLGLSAKTLLLSFFFFICLNIYIFN